MPLLGLDHLALTVTDQEATTTTLSRYFYDPDGNLIEVAKWIERDDPEPR